MAAVSFNASSSTPFRQTIAEKMQHLAEAIGKIVLQVLLPLAACLLLYSVLPACLGSFFIPLVALGMPSTIAFLFNDRTKEAPAVPLPPHAPRGIHREGNNCWVNALLQLLQKDAPLQRYFAQQPESPIALFFQNYRQTKATGSPVVAARSQLVREWIATKFHSIPASSLTQQDCTEGFMACTSDLPDADKTGVCETRRFFEGIAEPRVNQEPALGYVSLGITGEHPNLAGLMMPYAMSINEDPENRIIVDGVHHRLVREERVFTTPPPSLFIHIKRFFREGNTTKKIHTQLELPEEYAIGDARFLLDAIVSHQGATPNSGHYVAYVKEGDDWFRIDDRQVVPIRFADIPKHDTYFIHYSRNA